MRPLSLLGAGSLLLLLTATSASAQYCSRPQSHGYSHGHRDRVVSYRNTYRPTAHRRIVRVAPSYRVLNDVHYGGPIYYRNASLYVRPSASIRRAAPRCYSPAPPRRHGRYSRY